MNIRKYQGLIKKVNFFFIALTLWFFSFSSSATSADRKRQFICGYKTIVEYINSLISRDRLFLMYQLQKLQDNTITKDDKWDLTVILMRYRLLPLDETKTRKCRFFNYLCVHSNNETDIMDTLHDYAYKYLNNNPEGPSVCHIRSAGRELQKPLLSSACKEAIQKRVQPVPPPLAITQAGLESRWGTSYFSKKGNNFFGIQTSFRSSAKTRRNTKCIPARRNPRRCVYKFRSVENNYFIYSQLLNSGNAYLKLRDLRYQSLSREEPACKTSMNMAQGLRHYAEDPNYIRKLRGSIKKVCTIMDSC